LKPAWTNSFRDPISPVLPKKFKKWISSQAKREADMEQIVSPGPISTGRSWARWCTCHPSYDRKHKGSQFRSAWAEKQDPISKIIREKRAGGMAQVIECLPSNTESLSSNPSTPHHIHKKMEKIHRSLLFIYRMKMLLTESFHQFSLSPVGLCSQLMQQCYSDC
jgi:hypothetical protein